MKHLAVIFLLAFAPFAIAEPTIPSADDCTKHLTAAWDNYLWSKKAKRSEKYLSECNQRIVLWQAVVGCHKARACAGCDRGKQIAKAYTEAVLESRRCSKTELLVEGWPSPVPVEHVNKENP